MVARGSVDALAEFRLSRWDIAASEVVVEEAGGRALIREARHAPGKYDCILGSPQAALDVATILGFEA
jgi:fructose-1,6-bisphosphatase/inositol monophosphatase family enzyme